MIPPIKMKMIQQGLALLSPEELKSLMRDLDDIQRTPPDRDWKHGEWRKQASTIGSPKDVQQEYQRLVDKRRAKPTQNADKSKFSEWMSKTKKMFGGGG